MRRMAQLYGLRVCGLIARREVLEVECEKLRAAVVGAAGYAGIEVTRLICGHPGFELVLAASEANAGQRLSDLYPALRGVTDLEFEVPDAERIASSCDIAFLAVPHTAAMAVVPGLLEKGIAVIDLSADYRLHDAAVFERWYKAEHTSPELLVRAVFGQPELHREALSSLADAWCEKGAEAAPLVACAGCYVTATLLAASPALARGLCADRPLVANAMSGVSGAGKGANAKTHFCNASDDVKAYSAGTHRHTPEIEQELSEVAGRDVKVVFIPHLVPMKRGLLSTVTMELAEGVTFDNALNEYADYYDGEPFVHFIGTEMPRTMAVVGGNHAQVGLAYSSETNMLIASCAIDNLDKGAASQAVQCANIVCGFDERAGLDYPVPVV